MKSRILYRKLRSYYKKSFNILPLPDAKPIFILGHEKSGTSVIASAIAQASQRSHTIDIPGFWNPVHAKLLDGDVSFETVVRKNKFEFRKAIIKEPIISFYYDELKRLFPKAQFVLIVREPKANIKSLLSRLKISGTLDKFDWRGYEGFKGSKLTWEPVIMRDAKGKKGEDYIYNLADRWNYLANLYLNNKEDIILFRYEDFLLDKENSIKDLCRILEVDIKQDFSSIVNTQFKYKSKSDISLEDFFGKNYTPLDRMTISNSKLLGYQTS